MLGSNAEDAVCREQHMKQYMPQALYFSIGGEPLFWIYTSTLQALTSAAR